MLGELLFVCEQLALKLRVLALVRAAAARARERECVKHSVLEASERLRRSARYLYIVAREVEHVWRRVRRAQHAVGVEEAALGRRAQRVREHDLENVALADIFLRALHHRAEFLLREARRKLLLQLQRTEDGLRAARKQRLHLVERLPRAQIARVSVVRGNARYEQQLLAVMVEGDHLVEKHQVRVAEVAALAAAAKRRLAPRT